MRAVHQTTNHKPQITKGHRTPRRPYRRCSFSFAREKRKGGAGQLWCLMRAIHRPHKAPPDLSDALVDFSLPRKNTPLVVHCNCAASWGPFINPTRRHRTSGMRAGEFVPFAFNFCTPRIFWKRRGSIPIYAVGCPRATKACSRARGILPSPAETRDREVRRKPFAEVRTKSISARHLVVGCPRATKACSRARGILPSPAETRDREVRRKPFAEVRTKSICPRDRAVRAHRAGTACLCAHGTLPSASKTKDREVRRKPFAEVRTESISARHLVVGCPRATNACLCAQGTLPLPSETRDREVRRKPGAEVRTKVVAHVTVPWDAPELPRRVHMLTVPCRHNPRHGRAHQAGTACLCARGTVLSPSETRDREVRRKPGAEVRTKVFAHANVPWGAPEYQGVFTCSRYPAVTIRDTGELTKLVRRVFVLAVPCRHHPRHGTGRSGESQVPRSGRKYLRTLTCRGVRPSTKACSHAHGTLPSQSETRESSPSWYGVSLCSRSIFWMGEILMERHRILV